MQGTRWLSVIAVVVLLLAIAAGVVAAAGKGSGGQPNDPIALYGGDEGSMQNFSLRNTDQDEATISVSTELLADKGGNIVGDQYWQCLNSSIAWHCTSVIILTAAAPTGAGTITLEGLFDGFNGESLAVTGGTGAYASAQGSVVLSVEGDRFLRTVDLTP